MALKMLAGTKTITTIQEGSVYKERWTTGSTEGWPAASSARMEFLDSAGQIVVSIDAESVNSRYITFRNAYEDVAEVSNGMAFRCYLNDPADLGEQMVKYGTVFRRENFFPHSPAQLRTYEPKRFTDTFQRPPGQLGGKWVTLLGRPIIGANGSGKPNSVGPDFAFFSRYFTRYYVPFTGDSVDLSISLYDKGAGNTIVALNCNSDGTRYNYVAFDSTANEVGMGIGHGTDLAASVLEPMVSDVPLTVPGTSGQPGNYKIRFDEATKTLGFYNTDFTTKYLEWHDSGDDMVIGKGYRYFGVGGGAGLIDSGDQIAYISAANIV